MKIGIIGAGISGLTAGRELAKAGHDVTVIEKSRGFGGRLATRYAGKDNSIKLDHGVSSFTAESAEFSGFVSELLEKNLIRVWGNRFSYHDGNTLYEDDPNANGSTSYTATEGMNRIGKYLARWVDVKTEEKAGGLTYFGPYRTKKRPWMINLTNYNTFEADAVIIALPAPQAYGVILTCQDEIDTLKIISQIDEIHYDPAYMLLAGYGSRELPDWEGIQCQGDDIEFITNEGSKRELPECSLVIRSTPQFVQTYRERSPETIQLALLERASAIAGDWIQKPEWKQLHFWRYKKARKILNMPYLDFEELDSPLALVGDYFSGSSVDSAYCSGLKLARNWIEKFDSVRV
ncbi:MAG: FAD-dependent oxidoreductase [Balneolaceae bacterium]